MHRLVLLGLIAPIVAVGVVFWLFSPGGLAGVTYTPSQFNRMVQFRPQDLLHKEVTIRGYLQPACSPQEEPCAPTALWVLVDTPGGNGRGVVALLPQGESGWHRLLRRVVPGLAAPFPEGRRAGDSLSIGGTLQGVPAGSDPPVLVPSGL